MMSTKGAQFEEERVTSMGSVSAVMTINSEIPRFKVLVAWREIGVSWADKGKAGGEKSTSLAPFLSCDERGVSGSTTAGREERAHLLVVRSLLHEVEDRVGERGVGEGERFGVRGSCARDPALVSSE